MSSDGSSFPPVTPDFVYIVKIGDFQHVLRPADLKSSNNLSLARHAVANIDMARNLLTERGPFLVSEKQQKMDELICDTEEAINRVVKLLQPARVEQVSEESIRINTKTAWALQDGPKSSATFGRLQITHDRLKTVLHDLKNIEATAQLDDCEVRASTIVSRPSSSQSQQTQPSSPPREPTMQPQNPNNLLAWKRSRHRQSRQTLVSDSSSTSGLASDDHPSADLRSSVSSPRNTLMGFVDGSVRQMQEQASNINSLLLPSKTRDDASDVSVGRLSVIHELEGASVITAVPEGRASGMTSSKADPTGHSSPPQEESHPSHSAKPSIDTQEGKRSTAVESSAPTPSSPSPKLAKGMKRESFADYRERNKREREYRQEPQIESPEPTSSAPMKLSTSLQQKSPAANPERAFPRSSSQPATTAHQGASAILGKEQQISAIPSVTQAATLVQETKSARPQRELLQHSNLSDSEIEPTTIQKQTFHTSKSSARSSSLNTVPEDNPAVASQFQTSGTQMSQHLRTTMAVQPEVILSPPLLRSSPWAPNPANATRETKPYLHGQSQSLTKSHEIFIIDPELTRLPSLLRAGQRARSKVSPPYPISEADSDHSGEDQISDLPRLRQTQSAIERPITAPPVPRPTARATHPPLQVIQTMDDPTHQRSFSDPVVPQINVIRAPTVPRKPVPYRTSMFVSGAAAEMCRAESNDQVAVRPQSEFISSASISQHGLSGPPSPLQSDNDQNLALPMPSSTSLHSLSVQGPSSLGSSRRSSVSVEGQPRSQPSQGAVPPSPIPNPLAMHPTAARSPQASPYQAQSVVMHPSQQPWTASQPDYRSPAFQQSRHFVDPSHNMHLGPSEQPPPPPISRFRDSDQVGGVRHAPIRSRTEPIERHVLEQARSPPRRASEQDQVPPMKHDVRDQELEQSYQARTPQHDPMYVGRAQLVYVKQQPWPNQSIGLQPPLDRSSITRTAPPADAEHDAKRLPVPNIGRGASLNHTTGRQNPNDKDLFGRQVWLADQHVQQSPDQHQHQQSQRFSYYEPQQQSADHQRQLRPRPPLEPRAQPRVQPLQSYHQQHQHDCYCDNQTQYEPQHQASKVFSLSEEVKHIRLTPVQETQVAPLVKASAEIPLYPPQPQPQLESGPTEQKHVTKKRSSWLAHQANRSRLIKGRH